MGSGLGWKIAGVRLPQRLDMGGNETVRPALENFDCWQTGDGKNNWLVCPVSVRNRLRAVDERPVRRISEEPHWIRPI